MGTVYLRQEKYDLAAYHFQSALDINGNSPILFVYLAMALQGEGRLQEALEVLQSALNLSPRNPLAKYKRATVLLALGRWEVCANKHAHRHILCSVLWEGL